MEKKNALLLVFSAALISGFSIFMNKFAVKGIDSSIFTFAKNSLVAVFMLAIILGAYQFKELKKLHRKDWLNLVLIGLIGGSIPFLLFFKGLQMASGATSSLIHKTMFVFVIVFAMLFLKEKLNKKVVGAAILLLAGNYLMLKPAWNFGAGDLLILTATVFWAAENTLSKYVLRNVSGNIVAFGRMFFGALFILMFLMVTGKIGGLTKLNLGQINWIMITSAMLLLYVVTWYNGLKHVDVSLATSILLLGAPVTTLLGYFAGNSIGVSEAAGMLLLTAGVVVFMNSTPYFNIGELRKSWTKKTKV